MEESNNWTEICPDLKNPDSGVIYRDLKLSDESFVSLYRSEEVYRMSDGLRGRCLIINNYQFKSLGFRDGSQTDVINTTNLFKQLKFKVITKENLSSDELTKVVGEELEDPAHKDAGMFVLILMSHGSENGMIYGVDDVPVRLHSILRIIYNCEALENKPKFIIVKACAGDDVPKGSQTTDLDLALDPGHSLSNSTYSAQPRDVLILRSAFDGYVSVRNPTLGSPFINALVEVLYDHAHDTDLESLCKLVRGKIESNNDGAQKEMEDNKGNTENNMIAHLVPLPVYYDTLSLSKKLYLFPGISSDGLELSREKDILDFSESGMKNIVGALRPCHSGMKTLFSSKQIYQMSSPLRGRCLIINNQHFGDHFSEREGSETDVKNLTEAFVKLKFDVIVKNDLTSNEIHNVIEEEVANPDHKTYGMFALIIMTHGGSDGVLYGTDGVPVQCSFVLTKLDQSESLNSKPKLVLFDTPSYKRFLSLSSFHFMMYRIKETCARLIEQQKSELKRRTLEDPPVMYRITGAYAQLIEQQKSELIRRTLEDLPENLIIPRLIHVLPEHSFVVHHNTEYSHVMHKEFGSPFIRVLVDILYKNSHRLDIEKIFKQVVKKLKSAQFPAPECTSSLNKKLCLFPNYDGG